MLNFGQIQLQAKTTEPPAIKEPESIFPLPEDPAENWNYDKYTHNILNEEETIIECINHGNLEAYNLLASKYDLTEPPHA